MMFTENLSLFKPLKIATICFFVTACGGGGDDDGSTDNPAFISGKVIDGVTGIPIENTLVTTSPPTEARLTDRDGYYEIQDTVAFGNVYDVTARQVGYDSDSRRISVQQGSSGIADFSIVTAINGLVSSVSTLEIPRGQASASFLLSSTIPDTGFSFTSSHPAFSVEPAQGVLAKNQHMIIQVDFTPEADETGRVSGMLVGTTDNGGTDITVNVFGNVPGTELQVLEDPFEVLLDETIVVASGGNSRPANDDSSANNNSNDGTGTGSSDNNGNTNGSGDNTSGSNTGGDNLNGSSGSDNNTTQNTDIDAIRSQLPINEPPAPPASLGITAPASRIAGSKVAVSWRNPERGSYVQIAKAEDPYDVRVTNYFWANPDSSGVGSGELNVPWAPGDYEIRMVDDEIILASLPFTVTRTYLEASPTAVSGSTIDVTWAGPLNSGGYVQIATAEDPFDVRTTNYFWVRPNSTATGTDSLNTPWLPGDYQIRFIADSQIIGARDLTVVQPSLSAPDTVVSGSTIDVTWTGPRQSGSYVQIAKPDDAFDVRATNYFWVSPDSTKTGTGELNTPWLPGDYEARLVVQDTVIARTGFRVVAPTLSGPASGSVGDEITVLWSGPLQRGSFVAIADLDAPYDRRVTNFFWVSPDSSAEGSGTLNLPAEPGTYEVRMIVDEIILSRYRIEVN